MVFRYVVLVLSQLDDGAAAADDEAELLGETEPGAAAGAETDRNPDS
jgi:hypothetical protein